jgi:hypothetical protein
MISAILAEASEPSKTPFYIAGVALAVWAVLVAFVGITRPDFPPGQGGRRGVILVTVCLVVAAMATAVITS